MIAKPCRTIHRVVRRLYPNAAVVARITRYRTIHVLVVHDRFARWSTPERAWRIGRDLETVLGADFAYGTISRIFASTHAELGRPRHEGRPAHCARRFRRALASQLDAGFGVGTG